LGRCPGPDKDGQNNAKNTPTCDVPPRKAQSPNEKYFFPILTPRLAESVKGLNSSLAQ